MTVGAQVLILGSPVSAIDMGGAVRRLSDGIASRTGAYVCVADVHSIMLARRNPAHARALANADMVTPDGTPLVWIARIRDTPGISRVCGPDLMSAVCEESLKQNWRHYFYGGAEGVSARLAARLQERHRGLQVVGTATPPFRPLTPEEDQAAIEAIQKARPDIVWVGLGCPKQEAWMAEHAKRMPGTILIGVGAAFNFHSGDIERAPRWMRDNGLEWLHRFISEPRRLWRRYLVLAPHFIVLALLETWLGTVPARVQSH